MRKEIGAILESLHSHRVDEAKQCTHVVAYSAKGVRFAERLCTAQAYNKLKKTNGYRELDRVELASDDKGARFTNVFKDIVAKYGLGDFDANGDGGTFGVGDDITGYYFNDSYKGKLPTAYATKGMTE